MCAQEEIIRAIESEHALDRRPVSLRVEDCEQIDAICRVHVDPQENQSRFDESLEEGEALWGPPRERSSARVFAVIPEDDVIDLKYVRSPPQRGDVLHIDPPDFLLALLNQWRCNSRAAVRLAWFGRTANQNCFKEACVPSAGTLASLRGAQRSAFRLCGWQRGFLWGPPGTGKTWTLGWMIAEYLVQFPFHHVLLLATTNAAVDQAVVAVDESLEILCQQKPDVWDVRRQCKRIGAYFDPKLYVGRTHLLPESIDEERLLALVNLETPDPRDVRVYSQWRERRDDLRARIRERVEEQTQNARLAAMTTHQATRINDLLETLGYDLVVFDEASTASLAHAVMLAPLGGSCVFAGDPEQLAPIVRSEIPEAVRWLGRSMFAEMRPDHSSTCMLTEQNRMAESICELVSTFYQGKLRVAHEVRQDPQWLGVRALEPGQEAVEVRPVRSEACHANPGWQRIHSADLICKIVQESLRAGCPEAPEDILVITPFRAQRALIKQKLRKIGRAEVPVKTIHRAQGSEYHTVLFDPVHGASRFLDGAEGKRLINVAISRAKARLVIVVSRGDREGNVYVDLIAQRAGREPLASLHRKGRL